MRTRSPKPPVSRSAEGWEWKAKQDKGTDGLGGTAENQRRKKKSGGNSAAAGKPEKGRCHLSPQATWGEVRKQFKQSQVVTRTLNDEKESPPAEMEVTIMRLEHKMIMSIILSCTIANVINILIFYWFCVHQFCYFYSIIKNRFVEPRNTIFNNPLSNYCSQFLYSS